MELILIHEPAIERALAKSKQYRSLNQSEIATSICLDILAIAPNHQPTLCVYILSLTDSLTNVNEKTNDVTILSAIDKLESTYDKLYFQGIFKERKARSLLSQSMSSSFSYNLFLDAINLFSKANELSSEDNDDAILRHNSCIRTIEAKNLQPRQDLDDANWSGEA